HDPPEVVPGKPALVRGKAIPEVAGDLGQADRRALGQPAGEPRDPAEEPCREAAAPGAGPLVAAGHRTLPAIRSARAARASASAAVAGHIGLKLYHWSGAALIVRSRAAAIACEACWRSAGLLDGTVMGWSTSTRKWSLAWRRIAIGRIIAPVLAASAAGPAGSVVQAPNRRTGMPSS